MKSLKKYVAVVAVLGVLGSAGGVFAATLKTPAEIVSGLTGTSVNDLYKERESGKTYGTIAKEAGKLDEFKAQMLEQRKAVLDERVAEGRMTQQQADAMYNTMKDRQTVCDGTGVQGMGMKNCAGIGMGQGRGMGNHQGQGMRGGMGFGRGMNQ